MLHDLRALDERRDRRMVFQIFEHLVHGHGSTGRAGLDARHNAQADRFLVRVHEAAAERAMGRIACEQPGGAFIVGTRQHAVGDGLGRKLEHFLHADGHLRGRRLLVADGLLGEQRIGAIGQDDHVSGNLVLAGAHAAHLSVLVFHQALNGNAVNELGARLFGLLSQPLVERRMQHRIARLLVFLELFGREIDREVGIGGHERDALMGDLALERSLGQLFVGEHLAQRMHVDAPARHVLGAGEVAALDDEHFTPQLRELVRRDRARKPRADDNRFEI